MSWWLMIHHGGAVHVWELGDPDEIQREELIMRARASVGFPPGDRWAHEGEPGVQVMLTLGEPHKTLMARATAHALSELDRIDATAYRAVHADQRREELIASAETAIASLPEIERLALRSRLGWSADPKPTEGRQ